MAIIIGLQVWLATITVILKILPYSFGKVETNLLTGKMSTTKNVGMKIGRKWESKNHIQGILSRKWKL